MNTQLEINGYKIFQNGDDAVYAAKSKEDVYNYFVENYGSTEHCQGETKEQFIANLMEIDLDSEIAQSERTWIDDNTGNEFNASYYQEYKIAAEKDQDTAVIAYLTW